MTGHILEEIASSTYLILRTETLVSINNEQIIASAANEGVITEATIQRIITSAAGNAVITQIASNIIIATECNNGVVTGSNFVAIYIYVGSCSDVIVTSSASDDAVVITNIYKIIIRQITQMDAFQNQEFIVWKCDMYIVTNLAHEGFDLRELGKPKCCQVNLFIRSRNAEIIDHIRCTWLNANDEEIRTFATKHGVIASIAIERIIAPTAIYQIIAIAAGKTVSIRARSEATAIIIRIAVYFIIAIATCNGVVASAAS